MAGSVGNNKNGFYLDRILIDGYIYDKVRIRKEVGYMTIEEMRERKKELGYSYEQIADLAHLPVGTVQKVLGGITKNPRYETLSALEAVFVAKNPNMIKEPVPIYNARKRQGEYTMADYFAMPDERRVELIDGVIYDMASPTTMHQILADEICSALKNYVRSHKGVCMPLTSPVDVQLDCDDKTMVQPDIVVICDRSKFQSGRIYGAPDLIVEVLSPSTRKKDMYIKAEKYLNAGVREYWIIDSKYKRIYVHCYEKEDFMINMYTFEDEVPVGIWNDDCKVNFREIYDYVSFLEEETKD